ncbi:response regulator transcription factor [Marinobacter alkaliphilus]|jgi:DNA-binding NarL/FixJ family response regulator|uniref:Response regulator transcription factor n=1 Tax=Marinobacter alkaliphilus TaxID=254719 RepID=A0ABZ3E5X3_9GAMM
MKILIADDHAVVRQGYVSLLSMALEPCAIMEAASGEEACDFSRRHQPDLIIMDVGLPGISGIEAAARILEDQKDARILFFSMYNEVPIVKRALQVGAMGYITKSCETDTLIKAVQRVAEGEIFVEYDLIMKSSFNDQASESSKLQQLTRRQFEVFSMLARGLSNDEIAHALAIEKKTVANTVTAIKSSLGIESMAKLVFFAIDAGLVQICTQPAASVSQE